MPSYQNNQIGMAALMLLLASASPALAQRADADQPISLIEDAPTAEAAINPDNTAGQTIDPAVQVIGDDQAQDDAAGQSPDISAADDSLANTSAAYAQVSLGRRKISEVGLAAIGVGSDDANDRGLDAMIWRGTSASDAVFLLERRLLSAIRKR